MPREIIIPRRLVWLAGFALVAGAFLALASLVWASAGLPTSPPDPAAVRVALRLPTATPGRTPWPTRPASGVAAVLDSPTPAGPTTPTPTVGRSGATATIAPWTATPTRTAAGPTRTTSSGEKPPASAASAGGSLRVGVRVNLLIAPADRERTLRLAKELGVQWLGVQVAWRDFQGDPNRDIDWRFLDDAVHEASGQGFKLLVAVWHVLTEETADRFANPELVAHKLLKHAYRLGQAQRPADQTAAAYVREQLDRLGVGADLPAIPRGRRTIALPPSRLTPAGA